MELSGQSTDPGRQSIFLLLHRRSTGALRSVQRSDRDTGDGCLEMYSAAVTAAAPRRHTVLPA